MFDAFIDTLYARLHEKELRARGQARGHQDRGRPTMATYNRGMADAFQEARELLEDMLDETQPVRG